MVLNTIFTILLMLQPVFAQDQKTSPLEQPKGKKERNVATEPLLKAKIIFSRPIRKKIEACSSGIAVMDVKTSQDIEIILNSLQTQSELKNDSI